MFIVSVLSIFRRFGRADDNSSDTPQDDVRPSEPYLTFRVSGYKHLTPSGVKDDDF